MTVLSFKPRQTSERQKASKPLTATLELESYPAMPSAKLLREAGILGRLRMGSHVVEVRDATLLGMAAHVANVRSVEVHDQDLAAERFVMSGKRDTLVHLLYLESGAGRRKAERPHAKYLFLKRLHMVLQVARDSKREPLSLLESLERDMLEHATTLVPPELRINSRFPRAPGYAEDGTPLTAAAIAREAQSQRVLREFFWHAAADTFGNP